MNIVSVMQVDVLKDETINAAYCLKPRALKQLFQYLKRLEQDAGLQ